MAIYLERTKSQMTAGADIFRRPKRPEVPVSRRYLGLTPQFLLFGLGFVVPFALLVATSFGTMQAYQLKFGFSVDNYAELISSTTFWSALRGSIVSSALAAALVGLFALPVSLYLLLRASDTAKPVIIAVLLLPLLTNYVVRVYALKLALANNGIVNYAIISLGAATEPARLLYTFPSVCLSFVLYFFFFNDTAPTEIYTLSLHDALPISQPAHPPLRGEVHHQSRHRARLRGGS